MIIIVNNLENTNNNNNKNISISLLNTLDGGTCTLQQNILL